MLAAFLNALRVVGKRIEEVRVVITGVGAAGVATTDMLLAAGVRDVVGCDRQGRRSSADVPDLDRRQGRATPSAPTRRASRERRRGARRRRRVHRAVGARRRVARRVAHDGADPIVFAMANPTPEVVPEEIEGLAAVVATGRSDYPNQINNVLAFPGVFRGALDVRASTITQRDEGRRRVTRSRRSSARTSSTREYIIPSVFNRDVAPAVAAAVAAAAERDGVARKVRTGVAARGGVRAH